MVSREAEEFGRQAATALTTDAALSSVAPGWRYLFLDLGAERATEELARKLAFDRACDEWWEATRVLRAAGADYWGPSWERIAGDLRREPLVDDEGSLIVSATHCASGDR